MAKEKQKTKTMTARELFIREWVLLCFEQLGYSRLIGKQEKSKSAIELLRKSKLFTKVKSK
jgi:hypothetical protein